MDPLPVVVIGAGPTGLVAAAHLRERGLPAVVLEAGSQVGSAVRDWGHVRTFTPWRWIVDPAAERLLDQAGWVRPSDEVLPTGGEVADGYLEPLAQALGVVRTGARVTAVTRDGLDKTRSAGREGRPFLLRVETATGSEEVLARAVIDASGTWGRRNPLGASGLPAQGEAAAEAAGLVVDALPDVLGRDRARFTGRRTLVVGMGHSAAGTLVALARLAETEPGTEVVWAIRADTARRLFGGGEADQLQARGRLGSDLAELVESGRVQLLPGFRTTRLDVVDGVDGAVTATVTGDVGSEQRSIEGVHTVVAATGFRPDLAMLAEVRLDLDPGLEAPRQLAPLIDPQFHSCGTVPPHGHRELEQPEPGFYLAGMKSYGRAPTFLIATGNEQVRSIAAAIAGDTAAADLVQLELPETGVCSTNPAQTAAGAVCCGTGTSEPALVGAGVGASHPTAADDALRQGFATGRAGGLLAERGAPAGAGCCS